MLLNKKNLLVGHAASKDETRHSIMGIKIDKDGTTTATDGHILVKYEPKEKLDAADYPNVDGIEQSSEALEPCIIPADAALKLAKQLPIFPKSAFVPTSTTSRNTMNSYLVN